MKIDITHEEVASEMQRRFAQRIAQLERDIAVLTVINAKQAEALATTTEPEGGDE